MRHGRGRALPGRRRQADGRWPARQIRRPRSCNPLRAGDRGRGARPRARGARGSAYRRGRAAPRRPERPRRPLAAVRGTPGAWYARIVLRVTSFLEASAIVAQIEARRRDGPCRRQRTTCYARPRPPEGLGARDASTYCANGCRSRLTPSCVSQSRYTQDGKIVGRVRGPVRVDEVTARVEFSTIIRAEEFDKGRIDDRGQPTGRTLEQGRATSSC